MTGLFVRGELRDVPVSRATGVMRRLLPLFMGLLSPGGDAELFVA